MVLHRPSELAAETGHVELLSFWSCSNSHALAGFLIVDAVRSRPQFAKSSYKRCCIVEGLRCLDEMQARVTLHLVDAKGHRTLNSGLQGAGERTGAIITYIYAEKSSNSLVPARTIRIEFLE